MLLDASRTGSNHLLAVLATDIQQRLIVVQEGFEMFKQLGKDNYSGGDLAFDENRTLELRSIVEKSINLPAEVLSADFLHIHDRILNQKIFSGLIEPSTSETETGDWNTRYRHRIKALMPYLDKRLVCVCIRLPGVVYTIEIDPGAEEVIHWEWQST